VNFARGLACPIFVSYGYNDLVVCPTSIQGAINVIPTQKEVMIVPQSRHYTYPEQNSARSKWVMKQLTK
jgi:cephalosporin-C deacetylase-like acetyl esterase